jgi:uncharacterized membrane protein (DUF485 family)
MRETRQVRYTMKVSRQFKENFTAIGFFALSVFVLVVCLVTVLSASQIAGTTLGIMLAACFGLLLVALVVFGVYQIVVIVVRARAERDRKPPPS